MDQRTAGRSLSPTAGLDMFHSQVFLRDMVLPASVGVYPYEHATLQRVRVNVDLGVGHAGDGAGAGREELSQVVSYEIVAQAVRRIVASGHFMLVETLAERIAEACLADGRVRLARVRVEKLDVFPDAGSAGVEIERRAASCPPEAIDS